MKFIVSTAVLALALTSTGALAAPIITFNQGSGAQIAGTTVFEDFEGIATGASIGTNAFAYDTSSSNGAIPAFGSTGNYGSVLSGGSYSVAFSPSDVFSFVLGSLDTYNSLTLQFADTSSLTYDGAEIVGGLPPANGDQGASYTNGVVSYDTKGGSKIVGAQFASSENSFEFDNLAISAVPEPATWGMMLLGFGAVGSVVRRRRQAQPNLAYAI